MKDLVKVFATKVLEGASTALGTAIGEALAKRIGAKSDGASKATDAEEPAK
jgi:hypothetical protein